MEDISSEYIGGGEGMCMALVVKDSVRQLRPMAMPSVRSVLGGVSKLVSMIMGGQEKCLWGMMKVPAALVFGVFMIWAAATVFGIIYNKVRPPEDEEDTENDDKQLTEGQNRAEAAKLWRLQQEDGAPRRGEEAPRRGEEAPRRGEKAPNRGRGEEAPRRGEKAPNRGRAKANKAIRGTQIFPGGEGNKRESRIEQR
eukprot:GHVQ01035835.1.p2 GENE.GHVQ01035835.1~~GHVQ01035835.1.p2  ORF type:complete len:197 (+),score=38.34 GHVQ01035835.1:114-704(+)